ncbi:hypothetical protein [Georgenia sp. Z1491]|uniref:hypothetical protein n=1 Tax=Georgenia sp. Z1491 TaxID=3416707 RepID=UPI003CF4E975
MLDRQVEVLLLDPAQPTTDEVLDAARRASLVEDDRLRSIYEVATDDGTAYVVGEPARGTTLADYAGNGPIPAEQARAIIGEAAAALDAARRHGVRHLALDARSVHVTDDGEVLVAGAGVANALGENLVLTPARASRKDASDLVELLYLALTGRPATTDDGSAPPAPGVLIDRVPHDLDDLCVRTLDEGAGPSSAGDLFHTLAPWGDIEPPPREVRRSAGGHSAPPPPPPPPPPAPSDSTEEISAVDDERPAQTAEPRPRSTLGGRLRRQIPPPSIPPADGTAEAVASGTSSATAASAGAVGLGAAAAGTLAAGAYGAEARTGDAVSAGRATASSSTTGSGDQERGRDSSGTAGRAAEGSSSAARPARDETATDAPTEAARTSAPSPTEPGGSDERPTAEDTPSDGSTDTDPLAGIVPTRASARFDAVTRRVVGGARPPVRHARVAVAHLPVPDPHGPTSDEGAGAGTAPDGRGRARRAAGSDTAVAGSSSLGAAAGPSTGGPAARGQHTGGPGRPGAPDGAAAGTGGATGRASSIGSRASAAAAAAAAGIGGASSSIGRSVGRARTSIQERLSNPGRLTEEEAGEQPLDVPYGTSGSGSQPAIDEPVRRVPVDARGRSSAAGADQRTGQAPPVGYRPTGSLDARDDRSLMDDRVPGREVSRHTIDPMPWVVVLFLVVVVICAWLAVRTLLTPTTAVELPSEDPPVVTPDPVEESTTDEPTAEASDLPAPVLSRTELVDPEGGGTDNADTAELAADGDVDTYWRSLSYQSPDFGVKSGTGLLVWLEEISTVGGLTIDTFADGEGGNVEIRISDPATPGEGELLAEGPLEAGETTFTWDSPVTTAHLIVWITELPTAGTDGANRAEIAEITVQ